MPNDGQRRDCRKWRPVQSGAHRLGGGRRQQQEQQQQEEHGSQPTKAQVPLPQPQEEQPQQEQRLTSRMSGGRRRTVSRRIHRKSQRHNLAAQAAASADTLAVVRGISIALLESHVGSKGIVLPGPGNGPRNDSSVFSRRPAALLRLLDSPYEGAKEVRTPSLEESKLCTLCAEQ